MVNFSELGGLTVLFIYLRTANPNIAAPAELESIWGQRGTLPACGFRDSFIDLKALSVQHVYGLSAQDTSYQLELEERLQPPYNLLSDEAYKLAAQLGLPIFQAGMLTLFSRAPLIIDNGVIIQLPGSWTVSVCPSHLA